METISMSRRERHRLEAFSRVRRGEITLVKASELLGLSYRQAKRCFGTLSGGGGQGAGPSFARAAVEPPGRRAAEAAGSVAVREEVRRLRSDAGGGMPGGGRRRDGARWRRCGSGCCRRGCGGSGVGIGPIGNVGPGRSTLANWCRWTVRITTGSKGVVTGRC